MKLQTRVLAVLASFVLLAAGCGDDDSETTAATTSSSLVDEQGADSDDTADSDDRDDDDGASTGDQAVAEAALLELGDLPSGWTESTEDDDSDDPDDEFDQQFADCIDVPVERIDPDFPSADSPTFNGPNDEEVSSAATIAPSIDESVEQFTTFTSDAALGCFGETFTDLIEEEASGEDFEVTDLSVNRLNLALEGDDSAAFRVTFLVKAQGFEAEGFLDFAVVRIGRATVSLNTFAIFSPFPETQTEALMDIVVGRVDRDAVT